MMSTKCTSLSLSVCSLQVRSNEDAEPHVYEQVSCGPWELTKANLLLTGQRLGQGQFGQVRKAFIKNVRSHDVPVAVKSLKGLYRFIW